MKRALVIVVLCLVLAVALFSLLPMPFCTVRLAYAADVHGNDINWVAIYHYVTDAYVLAGNVTTSTGESYRVHDNTQVRFNVSIKFDEDLASSQAEAISYTRVYMNITNGGSIWTNQELTNVECTGPTGGFYWLIEQGTWNDAGKPVAGMTYSCTVDLDGYY